MTITYPNPDAIHSALRWARRCSRRTLAASMPADACRKRYAQPCVRHGWRPVNHVAKDTFRDLSPQIDLESERDSRFTRCLLPRETPMNFPLSARPLARFGLLTALCFGVLCAVYHPALVRSFGHSDDYILLARFRAGEYGPLANLITAMGRPLNSLILWLFLSHGDDLGALAWLRAFGLLTQAGFAASVYGFLRRREYSREVCVGVAALWVFTPAMAVWAGWAIVAHHALGMTLAFWGGALLLPAVTVEPRRRLWGRHAVAALLLLAALSLYQPTFYAAYVPLLVWRLADARGDAASAGARAVAGPLLRFIAVTVAVLLVYTAVYKAYALFVEYDDPAVTRSRLSLARLLALPGEFPELLWLAASGFAYFSHPLARALVLAALLLAVAELAVARGGRAALQWVAGLLVLFGWSLLPFYAVEATEVPFRAMGVLAIVAGFPPAMVLLLHHREPLVRGGALLLAGAAACVSGWMSYHGIMLPNIREVERYRAALRETFAEYPEVVLFRFSFGLDPGHLRPRAEFGMHSMWLDWVPAHLLQFLLNEQFGRPVVPRNRAELRTPTVIRIYPWQAVALEGYPVIDDYVVRFRRPAPPPETYDVAFWARFGRGKIHLEGLGWVEELSDGWIYSPSTGLRRRP